MDYKASENVSWPSICLSACVAVCHVHVRVLLTVYRVRAHARICCVCVRGCMRAHQFGTVPVQSLEGAYRLRVRPDICCARSNPLAVVFFSRRRLHVMLRCPRSMMMMMSPICRLLEGCDQCEKRMSKSVFESRMSSGMQYRYCELNTVPGQWLLSACCARQSSDPALHPAPPNDVNSGGF